MTTKSLCSPLLSIPSIYPLSNPRIRSCVLLFLSSLCLCLMVSILALVYCLSPSLTLSLHLRLLSLVFASHLSSLVHIKELCHALLSLPFLFYFFPFLSPIHSSLSMNSFHCIPSHRCFIHFLRSYSSLFISFTPTPHCLLRPSFALLMATDPSSSDLPLLRELLVFATHKDIITLLLSPALHLYSTHSIYNNNNNNHARRSTDKQLFPLCLPGTTRPLQLIIVHEQCFSTVNCHR